MKYDFSNKAALNDFSYAYSLVANSYNGFAYENGHLVNAYNESIGGYDYVSLVHKDSFEKGAQIYTECSFDSYGAPLVTVANGVSKREDGILIYGDHYEVVAYEGGCNVWYITKAEPGSQRPFKVESCVKIRFQIPDKSRICMSVELLEAALRVNVNGVEFDIPAPKLAKNVRFGITACEGINRFYMAQINA